MDSPRIPSGIDVKLLAGRDPRQEEVVGGHTKITQRAVINNEAKTITIFVDTTDYQHATDKNKFIVSKIKEQLRNIDQTPKGVTHRSEKVTSGTVKPSALKGEFHEKMISISQGKKASQPLEHQSAHVGKGKVDDDVIKQLDESLESIADDISAFTEVRKVLQDEFDHLIKELKNTRSQSRDYREPLKEQIATISADFDNRIAKQKEHDKENGVDPKKGSKELHKLVEQKAQEIDRASSKVALKEGELIQQAREIESHIEDIESKIVKTDKSIRELSNTYAEFETRRKGAVSEMNKDSSPKRVEQSPPKPVAGKEDKKPAAPTLNMRDLAESRKKLKPSGKAAAPVVDHKAQPQPKPAVAAAQGSEHKPIASASSKAAAANLRQSSDNLEDDFVELGGKPAAPAPQSTVLKEAVEGSQKKEERKEDVHLDRSMGAAGRKPPSRKKRDTKKT